MFCPQPAEHQPCWLILIWHTGTLQALPLWKSLCFVSGFSSSSFFNISLLIFLLKEKSSLLLLCYKEPVCDALCIPVVILLQLKILFFFSVRSFPSNCLVYFCYCKRLPSIPRPPFDNPWGTAVDLLYSAALTVGGDAQGWNNCEVRAAFVFVWMWKIRSDTCCSQPLCSEQNGENLDTCG